MQLLKYLPAQNRFNLVYNLIFEQAIAEQYAGISRLMKEEGQMKALENLALILGNGPT